MSDYYSASSDDEQAHTDQQEKIFNKFGFNYAGAGDYFTGRVKSIMDVTDSEFRILALIIIREGLIANPDELPIQFRQFLPPQRYQNETESDTESGIGGDIDWERLVPLTFEDEEVKGITAVVQKRISNLRLVRRAHSLSEEDFHRLGLIIIKSGFAQNTSKLPSHYRDMRPPPGVIVDLGIDEENVEKNFEMKADTVVPLNFPGIGDIEVLLQNLAKAICIFDTCPPDIGVATYILSDDNMSDNEAAAAFKSL